MITIRVEPIGITIPFKNGMTIYEGLKEHGITIESPCGGLGVCGGCRVWADPPESVPPTPNKKVTDEESERGLRLACTAIPEKDCTLRLEENYVYEKAERNQGRIIEAGTDTEAAGEIHSAVTVESENGKWYARYHKVDGRAELSVWQPEFRAKGLAIDIGTTTMVVSLLSLETGAVLATASCLNPQIVHGHDVISRINFASNPEGLDTMGELVRGAVNKLMEEACTKSGGRPEEILDVAVGANTTMLQLAAKIDPAPLGRTPFRFDIKDRISVPVTEFGFNTNPGARVYIPPVMHAFVGTDISAGLILCPGFFDSGKSVLFMDMGTNGEIGLNVKGKWYATSTAAGPAFEGMGLSTGMRATDGAVERVSFENGKFTFETIGGGPAKGVCGSGIVDFISALLDSGVMESSGRLFTGRLPDDPVEELGNQVAFRYAENLHLTQKDIRQIQLAKGAVRTGVDIILKSGGIDCGELDRIYLAGGFGKYLKPESMEKIGILPPGSADKVLFCGNTSIGGAIRLLTHVENRDYLEKSLEEMTYVSLASTPGFMDVFTSSLNFPEQ